MIHAAMPVPTYMYYYYKQASQGLTVRRQEEEGPSFARDHSHCKRERSLLQPQAATMTVKTESHTY
jgi:hypothetical protein